MASPGGGDPATADSADVSGGVRTAFWSLVVLLNLSIGALAVGLMLVGFRGRWGTGGAIALVGAAGLVVAVVRYRRVRGALESGSLADGRGETDVTDGE